MKVAVEVGVCVGDDVVVFVGVTVKVFVDV